MSRLLLALALVGSPAWADDFVDRGRAALEAREFGEAADIFEAAIDADPDNARYHHLYGSALAAGIHEANVFRKPGMARGMRKAWERAVELDPDFIDAQVALFQYYMNAPRIAGGSREKALARIAEVTRIADARADDLDARMTQAFLCQQVEDWACATEAFEKVVAVEPERMMAWYQIGRTALLSGHQLDRGADALLRYLEHTPTEGEPSLAWAHTRLGQLYARHGRTDEARAHYDAALALEPDHEEAKQALGILR